MSDLGSQLRAYYDRISRPTDPEDVVAEKVRRTMLDQLPMKAAWWRRPAITVTAAALATLLLVGGGTYLLLHHDREDVASTDVTTTTTTATTAFESTTLAPIPSGAPVIWERIPDQDSLRYASMNDVVEFNGGLIAVGNVPEEGYSPGSTEWSMDGAVWMSDDGRSWDRIDTVGLDGSASLILDEVVVVPDGLLAFGHEEAWVALDRFVFTSPDGITWTRAAELGPVEIAGRFATDDGWLIVGYDARVGAAAWTTPDLITWTRIDDPDFASIDDNRLTYIFDAIEIPDGYLAVGRDDAGHYEIVRDILTDCAAGWFSADGLDWQRISTFELCDADSGLWQIAEVEGRFYADGGLVHDLWLFDDTVYPAVFTPVDDAPAAYRQPCPPIGVVRSGNGYEVYDSDPLWLGEVGVDRLTIATWPPTGDTFCATSDGGVTWSAFESTELGGDSAQATSAIAWDGRIVLVGTETMYADLHPDQGVVWIGSLDG